ncbi:hypothetical protein E4U55_000517 [Claviceps digitariae]|nr:hypothetical protein E4U55_000517 [Claviceps digitariae]
MPNPNPDPDPDPNANPNTNTDPDPDPDAYTITTPLPSLSTLLTSLKRSTLTLHNRLTSIHSDAQFVLRAASSPSLLRPPSPGHGPGPGTPRPLIANERCGSWYVPPEHKRGSAYFKSTDGHERAWKFSTRRLNMHLVDMIEENDGVIIVDSTRRGKRMPDALSTTIPIWCTVLNNLLLPTHPLSTQLFLPPHLLPSTHAQITALIPSFVRSLRELNLSALPVLTKPLRPFWITQDSTLLPAPSSPSSSSSSSSSDDDDDDDHHHHHHQQGIIFHDYRPVICLTASRRVLTSETTSDGYIQGAADDPENWACGLTPPLFWHHLHALLSAPDAHLPDLIASLLQTPNTEPHLQTATPTPSPVQLTPVISISSLPLPPPPHPPDQHPPVCHVLLTEQPTPPDTWVQSPTSMLVGLGKHKTGSRNLRLALPHICAFVSAFLQRGHPPAREDPDTQHHHTRDKQVVVACPSGRDTSVGTALALSCYLFDEQGRFRVPDARLGFTKSQVKAKLASIMTAYPAGNPSRQTLQSVNSFLMDWTR